MNFLHLRDQFCRQKISISFFKNNIYCAPQNTEITKNVISSVHNEDETALNISDNACMHVYANAHCSASSVRAENPMVIG